MDYAQSEWFLPDRGERTRFAANPADLMVQIAAATGGKYVVIPPAPTSRGGSVDFQPIRKHMKARMAAIFESLAVH
jgi:hypothetical protein